MKQKMLPCSFLYITIYLLFSLLIPTYSYLNATPFYDLIGSTCKTCAEKSANLNYGFCETTLRVNPASHATDLQGLAIVVMELALGNATSTVSTIEKMLSSKEYDPFAMNCLRDCLELYTDATGILVASTVACLLRQFGTANILMSAAMEVTTTCEEGFMERKGEVSPLSKENYNLFEISGIALCIVNLISPKIHSLY